LDGAQSVLVSVECLAVLVVRGTGPGLSVSLAGQALPCFYAPIKPESRGRPGLRPPKRSSRTPTVQQLQVRRGTSPRPPIYFKNPNCVRRPDPLPRGTLPIRFGRSVATKRRHNCQTGWSCKV
jgi:hypothetical protein